MIMARSFASDILAAVKWAAPGGIWPPAPRAALRMKSCARSTAAAAMPAQTEDVDVEERSSAIEVFGAVIRFQHPLISGGGFCRRAVRRNPVDVLRRNGNSPEQDSIDHPVIAVRVVPGHKAFIAPEPVNAVPWQAIAVRALAQQLIQRARRRTSRQGDREPAATGGGQIGYPARRSASQSFGIFEDLDRLVRHLPALRWRSLRIVDRGDRAPIVGRMEHMRAGDDGVRPGIEDPPYVLPAQTAIDLDHRVEAAIVAQTP